MRIGFSITALLRGIKNNHIDGIGHYCLNLLNSFEKTNQDVTLFDLNQNEDLHNIPYINTLKTEGRYRKSALLALFTGKNFKINHELKNKIDIFHAPDHFIPKINSVPVVATIMDAIPLKNPEWVSPRLRRVKNYFFKQTVKWADHYITISDFIVDDLVTYFGIKPEKISVAPLGVSSQYFARVNEEQKKQILKKYNLNPNYFLFIGTLQPRKNVERIIAAHKLLSLEMQKEFPLVIIGGGSWYLEQLQPALQQLAEQKTGRWLEYVSQEEIYALLQSAKALVFPSLYEGFGLPVLEGFASQIPVITSNTTSLPEAAGDAALLVDPYSIEEIATSMQKLITSNELCNQLITKGLKRAEEMTWENCSAKILDIYKQLI